MRNILLMIVASLVGCGSVRAGTKCVDGDKCTYTFDEPGEGAWTDWSNSPLGINAIQVEDGYGWIHSRADGPTLYDDNHVHLTWTEGGQGLSWARTTVNFMGDAGRPGWFNKLTNGQRMCDGVNHAPRASDEVLMLTLYDDGDSYWGGFLAGDMGALGVTEPPTGEVPPQGYAVVGVVRKRAGEKPEILAWTQGPPMIMRDPRMQHLTVWVQKDGPRWTLQAKGDVLGDDRDWSAETYIDEAPNESGLVGIDAIVLPRAYCIYGRGGEMSRVFALGDIEARWR